MSDEIEETRSRNASAPAWNIPMNGAAAAAPIPVVMGADSWPTLSETANAPQRPTISLENLSLSNHVPPHSVRPGSSHNGATHRGRGRHNSNSIRQRSSTGHSYGNNSPSSQVRHVSETNSRAESDNNSYRTGNGQNSSNPSRYGDFHRRSNNAPPPPPPVHGFLGGRQSVGNGASDVNSHISYNARPVLVQPPPPPFPGSYNRPVLPITPYLPAPLPFSQTQFIPSGIHPVTGQPVFYGPAMISPPVRPYPFYAPLGFQLIVADLMKQIDYYFSEDSLVRDAFLRSKMDAQGWVSVSIIADFPKVKNITARAKQFLEDTGTDAPQFILNVMQNSMFVEVQGYELRKRNNWEKYVLRNVVKPSSSTVETLKNARNTMVEEKLVRSNSELKVEDKATNDQTME